MPRLTKKVETSSISHGGLQRGRGAIGSIERQGAREPKQAAASEVRKKVKAGVMRDREVKIALTRDMFDFGSETAMRFMRISRASPSRTAHSESGQYLHRYEYNIRRWNLATQLEQ